MCFWYTRSHQNQDTARFSKANPTGNPSGYSSDSIDYKNSGKEYIAALYVEGVIEAANSSYNQKWLLSTINNLKNDSNNVAIAMYVNSPGGAVYQADEVYFALKDYKKAGKKLYVYMGPLAASGGYYISCAGNKIYANRNTLTGCIGVLMGNFYSEITEEQEEIMQSISDECYDQFVSIVVQNRGMNAKKVRELADGRIYTAAQAVQYHLIDQIDTWDNMINTLRNKELKIPDCKVIAYRYEHRQTFRESMFGIISQMQEKSIAAKLGIPLSVLNDMEKFNSYPAYLYK